MVSASMARVLITISSTISIHKLSVVTQLFHFPLHDKYSKLLLYEIFYARRAGESLQKRFLRTSNFELWLLKSVWWIAGRFNLQFNLDVLARARFTRINALIYFLLLKSALHSYPLRYTWRDRNRSYSIKQHITRRIPLKLIIVTRVSREI